MSIAFIAIGSNLGDREKNCEEAMQRLVQDGVAKSSIRSSWYETPPLAEIPNPKIQIPKYINGVIKIETELAPKELLARLQEIEMKLGRVRTGKKWENRIIDLDILFYDDLVIDEPDLKVPHPELHKRMFVLEPLCDIEPTLMHPVLKKTIKEIMYENIHR